MKLIDLLTQLRALDVKLWTNEGRLHYSAPEGALTTELRTVLKQHKTEIIAFLQQVEGVNQTNLSPIPVTARDKPLPLSYGQQQLWFLQHLHPNSPAYNIPLTSHLSGQLNIPALEQSLGQLIRQHESLRTSFKLINQQPSQHIQPFTDYQLPVIDSTLVEANQQITEDAIQPFDLTSGPLFRARLFRLSPTDYILYFNFHHIIFDGWSMTRFSQSLSAWYSRYSQPDTNEVTPPSEASIQYADFAVWERDYLKTAGQASVQYWQEKLAGELPTLQLPTDHSRSATQNLEGDTYQFTLSQPLTASLKQLSQTHNVTLFVTLLTAFKTLLYRYTSQPDVVVGVPSANRSRTELEPLIGFFVNSIVYRTDVAGNPTFLELLERVREVTVEAQTHQEIPFNKVVEMVQPERNLSQQPLFQVMFVLQPPGGEYANTLTLPNVTATTLEIVENKTAKFDLTLEMFETEDGITGSIEYSTSLFKLDTIKRMAAHLYCLLDGIIANPTQKISELPLLTEAERHQILIEWNNTAVDYPYNKCLHHLFEEQVTRTPNQTALIFPTDEIETQQLTYQELNQKANQLAHYLQKQGVGPETLVGLCVERSLEMVIALLGILKAGGAYVPLDPTYPQKRLAFMLADSQTSILLTQHHLITTLPTHQATTIYLDHDWDKITEESITNPNTIMTADNLAYVIYTSGSTGKPKGAMNPHCAVSNRILWMQDVYQLNESDRVLQKTPFSFDVSGWEFHWPLQVGASLVIAQPEGHKDSSYLVKTIVEQQITTIHFVPSMLQIFLDDPDVQTCISLKRVICSGEALPYELQQRFFEYLDTELYNLYGPTEAAIDVTYWSCNPNSERKIVPIGKPISNIQIYLLDNYLNPVPEGVAGELHIGGIGLARGYFNRPGLTAEKFITNPYQNNTTYTHLYKTGDLARYLSDGNIEYLGRLDNQVKLRGFRIELGEIENFLEQIDSIQQAVVLVSEDTPTNKRLVAYLCCNQQPLPSAKELRNYLINLVPNYMIPATFVVLEKFPLMPNGKINRRALPKPEFSQLELSESYVAPRNMVEELLVGIWMPILGLERIGIYDDFFVLGGHSLQVAQIVFQLKQIFQVELSVRQFFETPTIAKLAELIQTYRLHQVANIVATGEQMDLASEIVLPADIQPKSSAMQQTTPNNIFLSGATGFLGMFLLYEILERTQANVYCLVRASTIKVGYQRIETHMKTCHLWKESYQQRIKPVIGDLAEPYFGLSSQQFNELAHKIDVIYHNAATTNLVYPYAKLKPINVLGTQDILRLATQTKTIPVHYISTISVFASVHHFSSGTLYETDDLYHSKTLFNGYCQSKWVSENLVRKAQAQGLPGSIYRPGSIVGHSQTGVWKTGDYLTRFMKGCLEIGYMPIPNGIWHLTPVDYISQSVVYLSTNSNHQGKTYHLTSPHLLSTENFCRLFQLVGYPLQLTSYADWVTKLIKYSKKNPSHVLYPLLPIFLESVPGKNSTTIVEMYTTDKEPLYDSRNVTDGLKDTNIVCPAIDHELFKTYITYLVDIGFLMPPAN